MSTSPQTSASEFRRQIRELLRASAEDVSRQFRSTLKNPSDVEAVHQLRVCVRRLTAALQVVKPLLRRKKRRKLIRKLKAIRRTAGEVRDLDVFLERVRKRQFDLQKEARTDVMDFLKKRRKKARHPLQEVYHRVKPRRLQRRVANVVRKPVDGPDGSSVGVRSLMDDAIDRFSAEEPAALKTVDDLHSLRIRVKRLRYSFETIAELSPPECRDAASQHLPLLKGIQDRLGEINDHAAAVSRLTEWSRTVRKRRLRTSFAWMAKIETARRDRQAAQFLRWWTEERRAALQKRLDGMRREPARSNDTDGDRHPQTSCEELDECHKMP